MTSHLTPFKTIQPSSSKKALAASPPLAKLTLATQLGHTCIDTTLCCYSTGPGQDYDLGHTNSKHERTDPGKKAHIEGNAPPCHTWSTTETKRGEKEECMEPGEHTTPKREGKSDALVEEEKLEMSGESLHSMPLDSWLLKSLIPTLPLSLTTLILVMFSILLFSTVIFSLMSLLSSTMVTFCTTGTFSTPSILATAARRETPDGPGVTSTSGTMGGTSDVT